MTVDQIILIVYSILLEAGGAMGFIKAGSKASLIASTILSAIVLIFAFLLPAYAWIVLAFLIVFFGLRLARGGKFMPNGMMLILTIIALALIQLL